MMIKLMIDETIKQQDQQNPMSSTKRPL